MDPPCHKPVRVLVCVQSQASGTLVKNLSSPTSCVHMRVSACVQLRARSVQVDISISDDSGPKAANFLAQQVRCFNH